MTKEITREKTPSLMEYEKIINVMMKENEALKKRVAELEELLKILPDTQVKSVETPTPIVKKEIKKPSKIFKKIKKKEVTTPIVEEIELLKPSIQEMGKSIDEPTIIFDAVPPALTKHRIIEGISRRECPGCGNTVKSFIQEVTDKTNIIMDYPRMYGKKIKCGKCGIEWRLQKSIE